MKSLGTKLMLGGSEYKIQLRGIAKMIFY